MSHETVIIVWNEVKEVVLSSPQNREVFRIQTRLNPPPEILVQAAFAGEELAFDSEKAPPGKWCSCTPLGRTASDNLAKNHPNAPKQTNRKKASTRSQTTQKRLTLPNALWITVKWVIHMLLGQLVFRDWDSLPPQEALISDLYPRPP